jgi:hypothetical protein
MALPITGGLGCVNKRAFEFCRENHRPFLPTGPFSEESDPAGMRQRSRMTILRQHWQYNA